MNHLVHLNAQAGELEKILSGTKTMVLKEFELETSPAVPVKPGDSLYFLRDKYESSVRVKATVLGVIACANNKDDNVSNALKEMQSRLQLTEEQFCYWSVKKQVWLVEFSSAHKIEGIQVRSPKNEDQCDWIAFEDFCIGG